MTKRLSIGVLLVTMAVLMTAMSAIAAPKEGREWRGTEDPYVQGLPLFFRSQAGTSWVNVGQACDSTDTTNSTHSPSQVWCFEGANGDSHGQRAAAAHLAFKKRYALFKGTHGDILPENWNYGM